MGARKQVKSMGKYVRTKVAQSRAQWLHPGRREARRWYRSHGFVPRKRWQMVSVEMVGPAFVMESKGSE